MMFVLGGDLVFLIFRGRVNFTKFKSFYFKWYYNGPLFLLGHGINMKIYLLFICLILNVIISAKENSSNQGKRGWRESYGGDAVISEFKYFANDIFYHTQFGEHKIVDFNLINKTISNVDVVCSTDLSLGGEKKHAISYPNLKPQKIELDCGSWRDQLTVKQKKLLVVHEILPLVGVLDQDYKKSNAIFSSYLNYKSQSINNLTLILSIMNCRTEQFLNSIEKGEDVYYINTEGESYLFYAMQKGCTEIALELMNYKVPSYNVNNPRTKLPLIFNIVLDVQVEKFSHEDRLRLIKKFIRTYPESVEGVVPKKLELSDSFLLDYFFVGNLCHQGSSPLHYIASLPYKNHSGEDRELDKNHKKFLVTFINELIYLGFDADKKNICDESPMDLMRINNLID